MRFSRSRIGATIALALFVVAGAGCTLINKVRAKNELNETAKAYREGHFDEAEQHARRALLLDPTNKTAQIFIARVIHQQYKPGIEPPPNIDAARAKIKEALDKNPKDEEALKAQAALDAAIKNVQKAREAIDAYKRILETDPRNEEAYKAVSVLYAAIKDDAKLREWILARANDPNMTNEKRAEAYAILAGKDWDCSFKVTEQPEVKVTSSEGGTPKVTYQKPKEQKDFDMIQRCVVRGLEEAETAIKYDPNNESAWSYKTNLLYEAVKIAKMNGEADKATQYTNQAAIAQKRATTLAEERRKKEEAAEQKASPAP
jgi:tetratricopeptide (TPR) repeat protein